MKSSDVLEAAQQNQRLHKTDGHFYLQAFSVLLPNKTIKTTWRVDSLYDFESFDKKPVFDHCSISDIETIYGDSLEMDQTIMHVKLDAKNKALDITYGDGIPDKKHNSNLTIELK